MKASDGIYQYSQAGSAILIINSKIITVVESFLVPLLARIKQGNFWAFSVLVLALILSGFVSPGTDNYSK